MGKGTRVSGFVFFSYHAYTFDILSIWFKKKKKMGLVVLSRVENLILNTVVLLFSCNF